MNGYEAKFYSERTQRQIGTDLASVTAKIVKGGPHNTSTARLNQIADDLYSEGWYTISATIVQVAEERDELVAALRDILGTCGAFSPRGKAAIDAARVVLAKVRP